MMKFPKNDSQYHWTSHIKGKMLFYKISEQKIKTILKSPDRREEGIAPNTFAAMKRNDTPKRKEELWIMFQQTNPRQRNGASGQSLVASGSKRIMISAWRYPGKSQAGKPIPIPEDILAEIQKAWF